MTGKNTSTQESSGTSVPEQRQISPKHTDADQVLFPDNTRQRLGFVPG